MPRVASEASAVHHNAPNLRRPTAAEARQQSAPFGALLDDSPPPPSPHDHAERPQPSSAQSSSSQANSSHASSTQASQPDKSARRGHDHADNGNRTGGTDTHKPAADAKTEKNDATGTKAGNAGDGSGGADKAASANVTDTSALTAASNAPVPQPVAGAPAAAPAATAPDAAALVAAIGAPAASQPVAGAPAPISAATDPGAALPAAGVAAAKGASTAAADAPSGQAQGVTGTDAGATTAADGKGQTGRKGSSNGADGSSNANKARNANSGPSAENSTSSKTEANASDGQADPQAGAQATAQTESNPVGKGELAHHPSRTQDATDKSGETLIQADMQAGGTADKLPADAAQLASLQHPADRFANLVAGTVHTGAAATDPAAVPIAGLAVEIAARAQAGSNRFEIRLDPPDLGRIDVRLDIDRDGNVTSRLMVEKSETLDLLRRDAGELERALQQAGLKTGDSGLQFALRDQSFGGQNQGTPDNSSTGAAKLVVADPEMTPVETAPGAYGRSLRLGTGIDIRV